MKRNSKRFTFVEIMIVVALIGLLIVIAVPNYIEARVSARANTCVNNLRMISAAKNQAALENNLADTVTPTTTQLSPYLEETTADTGLPQEPINGAYSINAISARPTCSVGGAHSVT